MVKCGDGLVPHGLVGGVRRRAVCGSVRCSRKLQVGPLAMVAPPPSGATHEAAAAAVEVGVEQWAEVGWATSWPIYPACSGLVMLCCVPSLVESLREVRFLSPPRFAALAHWDLLPWSLP